MKKSIVLVCFMTMSTSIFAYKGSCSHYLRVEARKDAGVAISILGFGLALVPQIYRKVQDANWLKAAYLIRQNIEGEKRTKSEGIVDDFYSKLETLYPLMEFTKEEVVDALNNIYRMGVETGFCSAVAHSRLSAALIDKDNQTQFRTYYTEMLTKKEQWDEARNRRRGIGQMPVNDFSEAQL